jgi:hypothetical protein
MLCLSVHLDVQACWRHMLCTCSTGVSVGMCVVRVCVSVRLCVAVCGVIRCDMCMCTYLCVCLHVFVRVYVLRACVRMYLCVRARWCISVRIFLSNDQPAVTKLQTSSCVVTPHARGADDGEMHDF